MCSVYNDAMALALHHTSTLPKSRAGRSGAPRWLRLLVPSLLCAALLAVPALHWAQASIIQLLEEQAIEIKAMGAETPAQFGVPFEELRLAVAGRTLGGRIVHAAMADAPAVLIFHGNGEAVSDWAQVQARLYRAGVSSMVFDYSGFGNSTGKPGVQRMREDALAAYAEWMRATPAAGSHVLIGHSLGNAVMLDVAPRLRPAPSGLVVHSGFSSAREFAVRAGLVSPVVSRMLPDLWDNEAALRLPGPAVLVLHSDHDEVIPVAMGQRLAQAGGTRAHYQPVAGIAHDEFYQQPSAQEWDPILSFVASSAAARRLIDAQP